MGKGLQYPHVAVLVAQWLKPCLKIGFECGLVLLLIECATVQSRLIRTADGATTDSK